MDSDQPVRVMIGSQIIIKDKEPILVRIQFGKEQIHVLPETLVRLAGQLEEMAITAKFLERYKMMLTLKGEDNIQGEITNLLNYMGSLRDDTKTESQGITMPPINNISKISKAKNRGNSS